MIPARYPVSSTSSRAAVCAGDSSASRVPAGNSSSVSPTLGRQFSIKHNGVVVNQRQQYDSTGMANDFAGVRLAVTTNNSISCTLKRAPWRTTRSRFVSMMEQDGGWNACGSEIITLGQLCPRCDACKAIGSIKLSERSESQQPSQPFLQSPRIESVGTFWVSQLPQTARDDVTRRRQHRATPAAQSESWSCRHARSTGRRGARAWSGAGGSAGSLRPTVFQTLPRDLSTRCFELSRGTWKGRSRSIPNFRFRVGSNSRRPRRDWSAGSSRRRRRTRRSGLTAVGLTSESAPGSNLKCPSEPSKFIRFRSCDTNSPKSTSTFVCGSGTYVRTLGLDLAVAAGSTSVMTHLCRRGIGPFVDEASGVGGTTPRSRHWIDVVATDVGSESDADTGDR